MVSPDDKITQFQLNINYYVSLVSFVILYYDHALTLPAEIQRFWIRGPLTWPTLLFFVNRYLAFLGHFPVILEVFWNSPDLPHKSTSYHQYLEMVIQLIVCVLLMIRIYAIYGRKRWVVWLLLTNIGAEVAVSCWGVLSNAPIAVSQLVSSAQGCNEPLGSEQGLHLAVAWSGQLAFDAISFVLTVLKTFTIDRLRQQSSILHILLRDGAMYFAIMTAANLANILMFLLAAPISKGVTSTFVNIISVTMMSRLMLNLRDPKIHIGENPNEELPGDVNSPIVFTGMLPRVQNVD